MTVEIGPTLHCSVHDTFVLLPASRTFSKKKKGAANHSLLIGVCTGQEGRGCIDSQNKPTVPTDASWEFEEVVWHQNWQDLSKMTFQSSTQLLLFLYANSGSELDQKSVLR